MTNVAEHFDLAIIGTGSGNTILTKQFSGDRVAILESGTFGGTCINVGCIPTKMFVYAADTVRTVQRAGVLGIDAHVDRVRWGDIVDRVFGRIDAITADAEDFRVHRTPGTTVFRGHARFVDERTIDTGTGSVITADQVVVAAGARPVVPDVVVDSGMPFHTSDTIMRIRELPERIVILGGGFIAAEFAHVLSSFGVAVTIVVRGERLLRRLDAEISSHFTDLARAKWDVRLGRAIESIAPGITVGLDDGSTTETDMLLVATGRVPNGDRLNLAAAGIDVDDAGRVVVDDFQRTTARGVYALGDVSSSYQLKHVANREARVVRDNLKRDWDATDELARIDHRFVPAAVFTDPQIAHVGRTEAEARDEGLDVAVHTHRFGDVAYGWAMEDHEGLCKIVLERGSRRILGGHIIGHDAATLIQPVIQAMQFGLDARSMARGQYWIHPALPEVVENALLGALRS